MDFPIPFAALELTLPWQIAAAAGVSFCSTLVFTPLACWIAHRIGVVDRPDDKRKLQKQPVALLGGVAVLAGLGVTVFAAAACGTMDNSLRAIAMVSVGLSLLCAAGVIDDAFNIPPGWKLIAQVLASLPMIVAGCTISTIDLGGLHIPLGPLSSIAALVWLVGCTNAVNLIDGMDGLCSTVGLCIAAGVTGIALIGGAGNTMVCSAALSGALAGFLIFNLPPARIYLGDAGSMVIGMTLGVLTLNAAQGLNGAVKPVVLGALMFVPLVDVTLAMLRRSLSGRSIFHADRGHVHHRLLDHGLSVGQVLVCVAGICAATSLIAVATAYTSSPLAGLLALTLVAFVLVNRKVAGHHEWSLLRTFLTRRTAATEPMESAALGILQIDAEAPATLRLHSTEESETWQPSNRRAA
jgi:UDP-GlcNAc:undecaprenyl-phosphate GlcNAc-1-phosphate transferase